jgi:osmotically-inducible protein OsmY
MPSAGCEMLSLNVGYIRHNFVAHITFKILNCNGMGDKSAARNFPQGKRNSTGRTESTYERQRYYDANRKLGNSRDEQNTRAPEDQEQYDDYNTDKAENYNAGGYYGSNYGSINELNRGRDYERNAGYRDSYDHLTAGQWPEIERAAQSRGFDLRGYELAQRGVHRGKGPRGYQRTDLRIEEDINDLLMEDPYVDASEIQVKVENGDVVLTGEVEHKHIKRRVEDLVERVSGVKNLENRLRSRVSGGQTVNIHNTRR